MSTRALQEKKTKTEEKYSETKQRLLIETFKKTKEEKLCILIEQKK
jgi:hypothetical protein